MKKKWNVYAVFVLGGFFLGYLFFGINKTSKTSKEELTIKDLIYLGGGLTVKAANKLIIERVDLKTGQKIYQDVDFIFIFMECLICKTLPHIAINIYG